MPATFRFLEFFLFFPLKLIYFWIKSRKNLYGCFYHSFCATDFKFGTKNNGRLKLSTLKTLIFANFDLRYRIEPNPGNIFMAIFIDLWPSLFTTELCLAQLFKWGHSKVESSRYMQKKKKNNKRFPLFWLLAEQKAAH